MVRRSNVSHTGGEQLGEGGFGQVHAFNSTKDKDFVSLFGRADSAFTDEQVQRIVFKTFQYPQDLDIEKDSNKVLRGCIRQLDSLEGLGSFHKQLHGTPLTKEEFLQKYTTLIDEGNEVYTGGRTKALLYQRYDGDIVNGFDKVQWTYDNVKRMMMSSLMLLSVLHKNEFYHFDIKPENIFYRSKDNAFVLGDYGLLSDTWLKQGTPAYMSPFLNETDSDGYVGMDIGEGERITFENAGDDLTETLFGMTREQFLDHHPDVMQGGIIGKIVSMGVGAVKLGFGGIKGALKHLRAALGHLRNRAFRPKNFEENRFGRHPNATGPSTTYNVNKLVSHAVELQESIRGFTLPKHDLFALGLTLELIMIVLESGEYAHTLTPQEIRGMREFAARLVFARPVTLDGVTLQPIHSAEYALRELMGGSSLPATEVKQKNVVKVDTMVTPNVVVFEDMETHEFSKTFRELLNNALTNCIDQDGDMTASIQDFMYVHYGFLKYHRTELADKVKQQHPNVNVKLEKDVYKTLLQDEYSKLMQNWKRGDTIDVEVVYEICIYYQLLHLFYVMRGQYSVISKGFEKMKKRITTSSLASVANEPEMNNVRTTIMEFAGSPFAKAVGAMCEDIAKLGEHILSCLQNRKHEDDPPLLLNVFIEASNQDRMSVERHIQKYVSMTHVRTLFERILKKHGVSDVDISAFNAYDDLMDFELNDTVETFYYLLVARIFKGELTHMARLFALNVSLLKCADMGDDICMGVKRDVVIRRIQQVVESTKKMYHSFVRVLEIDTNKPAYSISIPLTAQDVIDDKLRALGSHYHMKYANVGAKFYQYMVKKKDSKAFRDRLCKYMPDLPHVFRKKDDDKMNTYKEFLNTVYKPAYFPGVLDESSVTLEDDIATIQGVKCDTLDTSIAKLIDVTKNMYKQNLRLDAIREIVDGSAVNIAAFVGSVSEKDATALSNHLQSIQQPTTIQPLFDAHDNPYIKFVKFYEDVSGAVRVFIRLKDNTLLVKDNAVPCSYEDIQKVTGKNTNSRREYACKQLAFARDAKRNETWSYHVLDQNKQVKIRDDIVISNESDIILRNETGNTQEKYGPFYKVIPPFTRENGENVRVNNSVIAKKFVGVENMSQLLTQDVQNLVLFTYGYSGSGKTYTLFGDIKDPRVDEANKGIVYSLIDNILSMDENVRVRLNKVHQVYGYINANLTLEEPQQLNRVIEIGEELERSTYANMLKSTLAPLMSRDASKQGLPAADEFIKNTPNNPDSSRGFLIVEFDVEKADKTVNKLCVVDMAGNEHPYDILMKTIPTFNLPLTTNSQTNLLTSSNVRDKDSVISSFSTELVKTLQLVGKSIRNPLQDIVTTLPGAGYKEDITLQNFAKAVRSLQSIELEPYDRNIHPVFIKLQPTLATAYKELSHEFESMLQKVLIRFTEALGTTRVIKLNDTKKKNLPSISTIAGVSGSKKNSPKDKSHKTYNESDFFGLFNVLCQDSTMKDNKPAYKVSIIMNSNDFAITLLFLYYVSREVLTQPSWLYKIIGSNDLATALSPSNISMTDALLNAEIERILYGPNKSQEKVEVLEKCKLMKYICNLLQTHDCFKPGFNLSQYVQALKGTKKPQPPSVLDVYLSVDGGSSSPVLRLAEVQVQDEALNSFFADIPVTIRVPGRDDEINAKSAYFERIIREGYYINQVNYELIRFFFLRGMSDERIARDMLKDVQIDYSKVTIENYNSMLHIMTQTPVNQQVAATTPWCMTSMLGKLHQILNNGDDAKEENNKYMMICNVRPEPNKFRLGAFQTLELVKTLSST